MKAALLREYHRPLELVDRPRPEVAHPSDVLVRIGGAGVCATDLHAIEGLMEPAGVTLPRVLGHENAGWVEELGDAVSTVAKGDAVLVYPPYSCGLCVACRRGNDMHCARHEFTGLSVDGGFAEYVLVSERSLVRLPAGVEPAAVAPHSDAGLTAYHAVKRLAHLAVPGSTAVIIGVGGVGHIALQLVRELGSSSVIAVDTDERRRRLATELGADEVVERADAVREADRRPRRRPRLRLRRHRPDPRRLGRDARPRRHVLGHRLRRHDLDPVAGARRSTSTRSSAISSAPGSTSGSSSSSTRPAA